MTMNADLINNFRCLIKSINWFISRKQEFSNTKFTAWQTKYKTDHDAIKAVLTDFDASTLIKNLRIYFTYLDNNNLTFNNGDTQFLENFENSETFMQDETLERLKDKIVPRKIEPDLSRLAEQVGRINLNVTLNIDNLEGNEEDLNDWFETYERISSSNAWTNDIRALKLPCYLKETALLVWQNMTDNDKTDYNKCKESILKSLGSDESFEQKFFERKQKDSESVTDFSLKLNKLAKKAFNNADKSQEILRVFWKGLKPNIKKLVLAVEPLSMTQAVETAKRAERYYCEEEKMIQTSEVKESAQASAINSNRPSRSKESKQRYKQQRFSSRSSSGRSGSRERYRTSRRTPEINRRSYGKEWSRNAVSCFKCGQEGHYANNCNNMQPIRMCYKCRKPGHIAAKCYSKKLPSTGITRESPVLINETINPHRHSQTFVNIKIKDKTFKVVVDSGAEVTLMNNRMANELKLKIIPDNTIRFIAANNKPLESIGWTLVELNFGQIKIIQKVTVINGLSTNMLLGTDCLKNHGFIINYEKNYLQLGKVFLNLITKNIQEFYHVSTTSEITVEPNTMKIEWIRIPETFEGTVYFENEGNFRNLSVQDGLLNVMNGKIPVVLVNKMNFKQTIGKGRFLGTLESVDEAAVGSIEKLNKKNQSPIEKFNHHKSIKARDLIQIDEKLTRDQRNKLLLLIDKYDHIFSKHANDLGFNDVHKFDINTGDAKAIKSRQYRVPYAQQETVDKMIDEMLSNKIISKSKSPWASPIVIVKKKDGSNRFCIDYRKLNQVTVKDNYPIPLIEETLDSLNGSSFFSSLDLASGYWQIALSDSAKEKTAFISTKGLFEFNVLPFGLSNAVSAFQRTMEIVIEGLTNTKVYLDDILLHSRKFDEHLRHLEAIFKRLELANLKLKPSKCSFGKRRTDYLGFEISEEGIKPSKAKTDAMLNFPRPKNPKQVKRFLGMASYYRKFIKNYSSKSEPINKLLKKDTKFEWTENCERNFKDIINALINLPILIYPDFSKPFILETDASTVGLGAVLAQEDKYGINRAVAYASRLLNKAELNYSATELECLAIVWATEQFKPYLYGRKFQIQCDHNPLVFIDNMKNKTSRVSRWRYNLAEYDYEIVYKKGSMNAKADALSRTGEENVSSKFKLDKSIRKDISTVFENELLNLSKEMIIKEQNSDEWIQQAKLESRRGYFIENNILYKKENSRNKLVIPKSLKNEVLKLCHDDMSGGHLGFKRTWPKVRDRFYWSSMYKDTFEWTKACVKCAKRKRPEPSKLGLMPINEAKLPFEMVGVDILGPLTETKQGNRYVLVFTDYLTRWAEAFAIKNIDAKTVSKVFVNEIVCRHSAPKVLLSDQGKQFTSNLLKEICSYLKTRKINTTAYHPECNGLTERFNATLCQILSMYCNENQTDWDEFLPTALFAYRTSIQETIQMSPFDALNAREARLPSNLENFRSDSDTYLRDFKKKWSTAYERIEKVNKTRKEKFDKSHKIKVINIADRVRLHSPATKIGLKTKLRQEMWTGPFRVIGKLPNGNIKLNIGKKSPYIVHPNRVKLAEKEILDFTEKKKTRNNHKRVSFSEKVEIIRY